MKEDRNIRLNLQEHINKVSHGKYTNLINGDTNIIITLANATTINITTSDTIILLPPLLSTNTEDKISDDETSDALSLGLRINLRTSRSDTTKYESLKKEISSQYLKLTSILTKKNGEMIVK